MASVRKRGDSYQVTVSNGRRADGSQIIETDTYTPEPGMTAKQIEKALEQFKVDFERDVKSGQNVKGRRMTLKELASLFQDDNKPTGDTNTDTISITTWESYQSTLQNRIIPDIGHLKIGYITPKTVKDYEKTLRQNGARQDGKPGGLSEATITRTRAVISTLLSYAVGEGLININPLINAGKQSRGHKAAKQYKVKYLTIEQTKAFLWALDNPFRITCKPRHRTGADGQIYDIREYKRTWQLSLKWRAYFYMALFVGDRRGENIALTWHDVNLETGEVRIDKSTAYANRQIIQKDTKTYKTRVAVVPPVVVEILKAWKAEQMRSCMECGTYWKGYRGAEYDRNFLFTGDNGLQLHPTTTYHKFKQIIRLYNENVAADPEHRFPDNITQHDLRHTAASILIANNMDPRSVAGILGHSDATTTLNIYAYFFQTKNKEAADIMQGILIKAN